MAEQTEQVFSDTRQEEDAFQGKRKPPDQDPDYESLSAHDYPEAKRQKLMQLDGKLPKKKFCNEHFTNVV